jgi:hypothetical protein
MSYRPAFIALALMLAPVAGAAAPMPVGPGAFADATIIPFPDSGDTAPAGLTLTSARSLSFGGDSAWDTSTPPYNTLAFSGLTITLDEPVAAIAFFFGSQRRSTLTFSVGRQGGDFTDVTLSVAADEAPPDGIANWRFHGFQDAAGIDTLIFGEDTELPGWYVGIGQLQTVAFPVPEPAALVLFGAGLAALGVTRRRR